MALSLAVSTQYTNVTDRHPAGQTDTARRHRPRLCIARQKQRESHHRMAEILMHLFQFPIPWQELCNSFITARCNAQRGLCRRKMMFVCPSVCHTPVFCRYGLNTASNVFHHRVATPFWPWVILSDLAEYWMTRSIERSHCDSWASCCSCADHLIHGSLSVYV